MTDLERAGLERRLWAKVIRHGLDECWPWTGATGPSGDPQIRGPRSEGGKVLQANRVAWLLGHGSIPDGHEIVRTCGLRLCINPRHLVAVTPREAARLRNRLFPQGPSDATLANVAQAWRRGQTSCDIADAFGIHRMTVFKWLRSAAAAGERVPYRNGRARGAA